ncbi:unnamed protein product, partial [Tetraodon nigroviridis]
LLAALLVVLLLDAGCAESQDYYQLLGNDPEAHERFLKVNQAYEVLKDEDLRKKYDKYGEKGFDDHKRGGQYESWNYYRYDFGIYDDDLEIITLDRGDFGNVFKEIENAFMSGLGWLVTFCFDTGDCLEPRTRQKLAGMLWLNTLDSKEIYSQVLDHLPELQLLTSENFESQLAHHRWLVSFTFGDRSPSTSEYKKLQALLRSDHIQYNIQAYPTTVIFNGSSVHEYEGHHSADGILEFIEDLVNPAVISLDPSSFSEKVKGRAEDQAWVVDFYAPWCGPCQALMPEWRRMSRLLSGQVLVGSVDCQLYQSLCQSQNVRAYPEIRLYSSNTKPDRYMSYNGWHRDAHSLRAWVLRSLPSVSVDLTPQSFRSQVLLGQDHWVLDFYAPWCGPCQHFAPEFEILARILKGKVRAGKIDCQAHQHTCQSAGISSYPTVRFYPYLGTRR